MLTINLPKDLELRLKAEACRRGVDPVELAATLIVNELEKSDGADPTIALMKQWLADDATDDPEELANQRREGEEFMHNLAQNRLDMEGPNARKLWP